MRHELHGPRFGPVGKLGREDALRAVFKLLRENADRDPHLRHAGVMALSRIGAVEPMLARLRGGSVPKELRLDVLEAASHRSSRRIKRQVQQFESSRPKSDALAAFDECLFGGDPAAGKRIFFEKAEAQCVRCHRIDGEGGDVGPELSHVGAQKDRRYVLESIVAPNQQIAQGFDSVTVFMKNGDSYAGVLKSETPDELTLNSADTGVLPIHKADIESRRAALSPMPEGLSQILTKQELRDLVGYLATLK